MTRRQNVARSARACRLYRRLLIAYPAQFRHEYGNEMVQVFAASYRETDQRAGFRGVAGFWMRALVDLLVSAGKERGATMAQWSPDTRKQSGLIALVILCSPGIGYWYTHAYAIQSEFICLLALAGGLGFVMPKRAWLWAIVLGASVPVSLFVARGIGYTLPCHPIPEPVLQQLGKDFNPCHPEVANGFASTAMFLMLIPAFLCAYAGAGCRVFGAWLRPRIAASLSSSREAR